MEQTKQYVNLGISPETRAKVNLLKAQIEMCRGKSITTDELINMMLESTNLGEAHIGKDDHIMALRKLAPKVSSCSCDSQRQYSLADK
jgi:hypothetical protein